MGDVKLLAPWGVVGLANALADRAGRFGHRGLGWDCMKATGALREGRYVPFALSWLALRWW